MRLAVNAHPRIALRLKSAEQLYELTLPFTHHRREDLETGASSKFENLVDDLLRMLPADASAALGAMRLADPGIEQS